MQSEQSYIFENGKVYTMQGGRVVSAVKEAEFMGEQHPGHPIHHPVQMPDAPVEACPECGGLVDPGGTCPECGYGMGSELGYGGRGDVGDGLPLEGPGLEQPVHHGSITTPNGLKGTILGRVAGIWGDEV